MGRRKALPLANPNPLRVWLTFNPANTLTALSDASAWDGVRLTVPTLSQWATGARVPSPANAARLERLTYGLVPARGWYVYGPDPAPAPQEGPPS